MTRNHVERDERLKSQNSNAQKCGLGYRFTKVVQIQIICDGSNSKIQNAFVIRLLHTRSTSIFVCTFLLKSGW